MSETRDPCEQIASVHLASCTTEPARIAAFYGAILAVERLGYRVTVHEWRDGSDRIYGLIARASPSTERPTPT